jgi:hypothetical protein
MKGHPVGVTSVCEAHTGCKVQEALVFSGQEVDIVPAELTALRNHKLCSEQHYCSVVAANVAAWLQMLRCMEMQDW